MKEIGGCRAVFAKKVLSQFKIMIKLYFHPLNSHHINNL
jgi:hypothetical protein